MIYKIFSGNPLIPADILNLFASKERAQSYYYSRMALIDCLQTLNQVIAFKDLKIIDHHHLEKLPHFLVSLSHTHNVGASVVASINECRSIGIDIEFSNRIIDPKTSKFFKTSYDHDHNDLLSLWVKKEASFKALSPLNVKETLVLTDIWVKKDEFGLIKDHQSLGKILLNEENVLGQKLLVSIAQLF
ncbi:MAG: hypothetical protein A2202_01800 [Bdellovibrionales bacterium RIFOXYA1_FULL_36_14]|nr:MAG: hypothetical protein A2202_01800 [Bdellovibrionales bacterium RIFOXYA1_FULL_36_14]